jgi:cytidine deaminase
MKSIDINWNELSVNAWKVREKAYILGDTKVGVALLDENNKILTGCNIEHKFRCHDIHAEVNAISNMISSGSKKIIAILIVAERDFFTPCGGCMDWIIQFGGEDVLIGFQNTPDGNIKTYKSIELMPHYPY